MTQTATKNHPRIIVCTGTCPGMTRLQLEQHLRSRGVTVMDRVNRDTEAVVCADPAAATVKLKAAREKGIPIYSYRDFLAIL